MTTRDVLVIVRRYGAALLVLCAVGLLAAGTLFAVQPRTYEASATIFISTNAGSGEMADLQAVTSFSEQRAITYAELVSSPAVLNPVIEDLGLAVGIPVLIDQVTAQVLPGTSLLQITAQAESPDQATELVDAVSENLTELSAALEEIEGAPEGLVSLAVMDTRGNPEDPVRPDLVTHLGLGAVGGLALGVGWMLLRHSLDTRLRSPAELTDLTGLPVITAPEEPRRGHHRPAVAASRREAFAALQSHLDLTANCSQTVVLASSVKGEETADSVLALAAAAVSAGRRTVVVDAQPAKRRLSRRLKMAHRAGLNEVLTGAADPDQVVVDRPRSFDALPAGSGRDQGGPADGMEHALTHLRLRYQLSIIDAPPVLPGTTSLQTARLADGILLVARAGSTDSAHLRASMERLRGNGATVLGVLLLQPTRGPDAYKPGQYRWDPAPRHQVAA